MTMSWVSCECLKLIGEVPNYHNLLNTSSKIRKVQKFRILYLHMFCSSSVCSSSVSTSASTSTSVIDELLLEDEVEDEQDELKEELLGGSTSLSSPSV